MNKLILTCFGGIKTKTSSNSPALAPYLLIQEGKFPFLEALPAWDGEGVNAVGGGGEFHVDEAVGIGDGARQEDLAIVFTAGGVLPVSAVIVEDVGADGGEEAGGIEGALVGAPALGGVDFEIDFLSGNGRCDRVDGFYPGRGGHCHAPEV